MSFLERCHYRIYNAFNNLLSTDYINYLPIQLRRCVHVSYMLTKYDYNKLMLKAGTQLGGGTAGNCPKLPSLFYNLFHFICD